jgi:hypothetical protein
MTGLIGLEEIFFFLHISDIVSHLRAISDEPYPGCRFPAPHASAHPNPRRIRLDRVEITSTVLGIVQSHLLSLPVLTSFCKLLDQTCNWNFKFDSHSYGIFFISGAPHFPAFIQVVSWVNCFRGYN